jgi:hypothetical protein
MKMKRVMILVLVLVAMTASACSSIPGLAQPTATATLKPTSTSTPRPTSTFTPVPTSTPTMIPTPANPSESFLKMFGTWKNVKAFRVKMTSTDSKGAVTQTTLEFVAPDRYHLTTDKTEFIIIGSTFYLKSNTTWLKTAMPRGLDFSIADVKKLEAEVKANTTTKFVGADVLDGAPMLVYEYTTTIKGPPAITTTSKTWVGVVDQLPHKSESTSSTGTKTVALYSDFNGDIKIEAPIK